MKFGLLYEHQRFGIVDGESGTVDRERQNEMFYDTLEEARLADEVGFDTFWEVEHHFLGDFSLSSAPEVFLSAVAQVTTNMRIGHGVVLLPFGYNHPMRVAERAATLDILSRGRLEFGTGRSASSVEMDGFGVDPNTNRDEWDEALRMIVQMWDDGQFSWESDSFSVPPRNVLPKPYQQPHPPIWMAGTQPPSVQLAAERGIGILHFTYSQPEHLEQKIHDYKNTVDTCEPIGRVKNSNFGAFTMMFCGRDDQEALELGGPGSEWYVTATNALYVGLAQLGDKADSYQWYIEAAKRGDFLGSRQARGEETVDIARMADEAVLCIGGPEKCVQIIREFEKQGVDQMIMLVQHGTTEHEHIMDSLRRFGEQVIPHFRD